ncbi:hypothetical protein E5347_06465 [Clostridium sartagoforme]|uniref:Uncharacterized protein n=1 Tax=Clostridium sartagoforme TaxID=84031 RepID=A0A4S2DRC6_9CLOT|nr:hypothetical protein [Clostridium sartagoforme]TGY44452.1 hypothetical protein E5347_06465 [Clostridium sartagoforme]
MDSYIKEDLISENIKNKLKQIYSEVVIEDIKLELSKNKSEILQSLNKGYESKKNNKEILSKLDQLLILTDMIENKDEQKINSVLVYNKVLLFSNIFLIVLLIISFFI